MELSAYKSLDLLYDGIFSQRHRTVSLRQHGFLVVSAN